MYWLIPLGGMLLLCAISFINWEWLFSENGKRVCAWCGVVIGRTTTQMDTHGICDKCSKEMKLKLLEEAKKNKAIKNYERVAKIIMEDER